MPDKYDYGDVFYDYIDRGARRSAAQMVPLIAQMLRPQSVLDVGCGRGVWLSEWINVGVPDSIGVDGDYVDTRRLAIPNARFIALDISKPFDLGRSFDVIQSLEVAEHIDGAQADVFVENLCRHGDLIIFSAAVPGQGGEMHVNEQPLEYWCQKFSARGYHVFDWIRPGISAYSDIEPWYRYNCLLFAAADVESRLPSEMRDTRLPDGVPIPDRAPIMW